MLPNLLSIIPPRDWADDDNCPMERKVLVTHLSYFCNSEELKTFFQSHFPTDDVRTYRFIYKSGEQVVFAVVSFPEQIVIKDVVEHLHGYHYMGRLLK
jgi:hypothetical protein